MTIQFTEYADNGDEIEHELPSKFIVCSGCEGHGTHLTPGMRDHAYSAEEFEQDFDEEEAREYFTRGGMYDVTCETCRGARVEEVVDEATCDKALFKKYQERLEDEYAYEREREAERRYGA